MDSFLMLFDNGYQKIDYEGVSSELWSRDEGGGGGGGGDDDDDDIRLPPEPSLGNVEYKLKLINPTDVRFERLVSQVITVDKLVDATADHSFRLYVYYL